MTKDGVKVSFIEKPLPTEGTLVVGCSKEVSSSALQAYLGEDIGAEIKRIFQSDIFPKKKNAALTIPSPAHLKYTQIILVNIESPKVDWDYEVVGAAIATALDSCKDKVAYVCLPFGNEQVALAANGYLLKSWKFDKYKTKKKSENGEAKLEVVTFWAQSAQQAEKTFKSLHAVTEGVFLTRHVVSEPPNVIYPETMAKEAKKLESLGVKVDILGETEMKKLGMNALLGVGQGSIRESQLVVLHWQGGKQGEAPIAIVGKGVTFDTGGISIKPAQDMDEMKADMAGSGVVLGLIKALAERKAAVNVVGVMGLVENMPSGSAQRPGDIVMSMSGQTIEILNTDAEGRLVLADALWYTQDRFKPKAIIDLATLTGAMVISLGYEFAGVFSNNDKLIETLIEAGKKTGEKLWHLPLNEAYDKEMDSDIADIKNISGGRGAGSITAAQFLQRFVNETPWAHIDIAGTAWEKKDKPLSRKGATAFGVRLLNKFIKDNYEEI